MTILVRDISCLPDAAARLMGAAGDKRILLFYGDMAAGKTTLIKALCSYLGVTDDTSSPTFSIVNEYSSPKGIIYHFDFYRLQSEQEAYDLGYEEYFYSGNYCFVEWPEKIKNLLPENAVTVRISILPDGVREIALE